jgi:hypothetical protein
MIPVYLDMVPAAPLPKTIGCHKDYKTCPPGMQARRKD